MRDMTSDRLISVIIPAYNCVGTIDSTVKSILSSGIADYEIILVDDGSSDGTGLVCDTLAKKFAQLRCVHQENGGVSAARNRGFQEASGEYIWFFDADDSVNEHSFPRMNEILCSEAPDMLVFGMAFDYYHHGRLYRSDKKLPPIEGMKSVSECSRMLYRLFETNSLSALWNRIIKRSVLSRMGRLLRRDLFLYEDLEFVLRVWKNCSTVYFYPEAIYRYRQSEDEGNAGRRLKRIAHIPDLLEKICEPLEGEPDKNRILLALCQTLSRAKITVSGAEEIKSVCGDFKTWIDDRGLLAEISKDDYSMMIYHSQVSRLIAKRQVSKLRHSVANWLKQNIGDFRKW